MFKSGPKEVFMHLLAIAVLYVSAISFGALLFQFIDFAFPDPLVEAFHRPGDPVRWAVASLVVVFPVYVLVMRWLRRDEVRFPERRELKIRKWLLYFTLFAAAIIIFGDLIMLIYNFLRGELTLHFLLKIAAIFFIAAVIFSYYLWNLRMETMASRDPRMRWFVAGIITVVVASVVGGFVVAGSPVAERARRFDERRIQNLQEIQWQIVSFWQRKEKLPENLDQLRDDISGFVPPRDPQTSRAYEYRAFGPLTFELCATFKTDITSERVSSGIPKPFSPAPYDATFDTWAHGIGRTCFERAIDPELYGIEKPQRTR